MNSLTHWWTTFFTASLDSETPSQLSTPRAVQRHRDRAVHDDGDEVAAAGTPAADHWDEFGSLPWISHIGDFALGERRAPEPVDLHVEALGFQFADGDCGGFG